MAGVAGPMLRHERDSGVRFLTGLAVGGALAGVTLAVPAYLLGSLAQAALPETARLWLAAAVCAAFGAADLMNRTPHVWRQVPMHLVQRLSPGTLGVAWGFDLGLLATTQKTTSLIWAAIAGVVLLDPTLGAVLLVGVSLIASAGVTVWSTSERAMGLLGVMTARKERQWVKNTRRLSGTALLLLLVAVSVQALPS